MEAERLVRDVLVKKLDHNENYEITLSKKAYDMDGKHVVIKDRVIRLSLIEIDNRIQKLQSQIADWNDIRAEMVKATTETPTSE